MGWTDEEIDNLYKKASDQQTVGYNDAYWKEMEAILNAEKPARKRFAWWFFGSALLMVMIALSYYYTTTNGTMISPAKTPRVAQTNNVSAGTLETTTGEAQNVSGNPISENNPVVSGTFIPSGEQYQMKTTETIPMAVSGKTHAFVEKQYETTVREENTTNSTTGILPATTNHHVNESATFVQEKQLMTGEPTGQIEEAVSSGNVAEMKEENPEITPSVEETTTRAVDVDELLLKKKTGFYVAADAGAGTSYLRQPTNLYIQWGIKAGVDYTIRNHFRLGGGLGFRQQMLNDLTVSRSREYYSLGLISVNQSIAYDRLQFVDLNIHAHYVFRKFAVGLEISPSYLISARAKMSQTQEENGKVVEGSMTQTTEKQYVRSDNFNTFGLDAGLSFQYQFKHQMLLELGIGARVNKLLMNTNFNGEHNQLPLRLELGFVKRF